jgi:transglutaminase-like putative cysteine protease
MLIQRLIAVAMILGSSVLIAWTSDIAFPAVLGMLGLLGVQRRFTWDIRPERHFVTPLLLLLLAVLFALHCRYAHVRADQAAAFAWQTIARYFLASMILILFLRPQRTDTFGVRTSDAGYKGVHASDLPQVAGSETRQSVIRQPESAIAPPLSLGLFHLASVMSAGQVLLLDDRYVAFRLAELGSVTLAILYVAVGSLAIGRRTPLQRGRPPEIVGGLPPASGRPPGAGHRLPALLGALLLLAINLGWVGGSLLYRHVEVINFLPAWLSRGNITLENPGTGAARVGFSTSGELSTILSIKEDADSAPVLTVTGSNPVYLRAMVFETYKQSAWHDVSSWEALAPEQSMSFGMLVVGRAVFRLHGAEAAGEVTIRHESSIGDAMFTPLGTCFVEAPFHLLQRDDDDIVKSPSVRNRHSYRVGYTTAVSRRAPTGLQLRRLTEVPRQLDPYVQQLAGRLLHDGMTTAEKIDAVTKYFQTNYTYVLGLEVPPDEDALNYFLVKASTGYCEYFASGAAILLRLADVPTRYVTGFFVSERGSDGRSWVARNMDAHAWVEAWDAERGQWTIVEATTQEGLDEASLAADLVRDAGGGRPLLARLGRLLYDYGLFGVVGWLLDLASQVSDGHFAPWAFIVAAVTLGLALRLRRRAHPPSALRNPHLVALHRVLAALDRRAKAQGYRRRPQETLRAFAERILLAVPGDNPDNACSTSGVGPHPTGHSMAAGLADAYRQYADLRYGRVIDPVRLEQLQRRAQERPSSS